MQIDLVQVEKTFPDPSRLGNNVAPGRAPRPGGQATVGLKGITYSFSSGVYAVVGPNGAGKTLLLRTICGLETPASGQVLVNGQDLAAPPTKRWLAARLGYVPQNVSLPVTLSVEEALHYFAILRGRPAHARVDVLLRQFELGHLARRRLASLSPGERRRFLIAQSLLTDPWLWVLDEPTSGLDGPGRQMLLQLINRMALSPQRTIIMATNLWEDAEACADQVLTLRSGRILTP